MHGVWRSFRPKGLGSQSGFSLVELLVTLVIIGVLSAIALPLFLNQRGKADDVHAQTNLGVAYRAAAAYYDANGRTYGNDVSVLASDLARDEPQMTFHAYTAGVPATYAQNSSDVSLAVDAEDPQHVLTMCTRSETGRYYCLRDDRLGKLIVVAQQQPSGLGSLVAGLWQPETAHAAAKDKATLSRAVGDTQPDAMAALASRSRMPIGEAGPGETGEPGWGEETGDPPPEPQAQAPLNTALPTLSGQTVSGQTLSASTGAWQSDSQIGFSYQWRACNESGEGCATINGASGPTYQLRNEDAGKTIRVIVVATNSVGATPATSAASEKITLPGLGSYTSERDADGASSICRFDESGTQYVPFVCTGGGFSSQLQATGADFSLGQPGAMAHIGDANTAVRFKGTTQWSYGVPSNHQLINSGPRWSAEAWVKPTQSARHQAIVSVENNWALRTTTTGFACDHRMGNANWGVSSLAGGTPSLAGQWYHVVCTYDSGTMRLYVNGSLVATKTGVAVGQSGQGNMNPGRINSNWTNTNSAHLDGVLDEVAFYKTTLSPERVAAHYHAAGY